MSLKATNGLLDKYEKQSQSWFRGRSSFSHSFFLMSLASLLSWLFFKSFSHQNQLIVSHWSLGDGKGPLLSTNHFCVLAYLNKAIAWMASTRPLIYQSTSPWINLSVTVQDHQLLLFFSSLSCSTVIHFSSKVYVIIFFFTFFQIIL